MLLLRRGLLQVLLLRRREISTAGAEAQPSFSCWCQGTWATSTASDNALGQDICGAGIV